MSSDDESGSNSSSDESEDINVTGLVATRARRGNAGNLYESLRAHLDDEELQKELLAEDEADDAEDYEGSDADDDNDALDSSSDEGDAGPPQAGEAEDLAGEKELLKAERAEKSKKRKAQAAKLVVPAFKKVKLADQVTADDGSISPIEGSLKKKKPARPVELDGPKRQSIRSSAIAVREVTQANLQESAARAEKQKASMQETAKRERANRRAELTLEQRLEKCKRIEKETAKELGRFEREEAERVRLREEALMAKRRKTLDGPVIRTLTTSGYYENGKLKIKRLEHGSQLLDNIVVKIPTQQDNEEEQPKKAAKAQSAEKATQSDLPASGDATTEQAAAGEEIAAPVDAATTAVDTGSNTPTIVIKDETEQVIAAARTDPAPDIEMTDAHTDTIVVLRPDLQTITATTYLPSSPIVTGLLSNPSSAPGSLPTTPAEPDAPVVREQAQRKLIILESFGSLDTATSRRSKAASSLEPSPIAQILLPSSYPAFTDEQLLYLRKPKKYKGLDTSLKSSCALTTWPGKYRDPRTGVIYADVAAYKMLQRMIAGGFTWNSMLECWTGPAYGQLGRPARGVPPGFDKPVESVVESVKQET